MCLEPGLDTLEGGGYVVDVLGSGGLSIRE